MNDKVKGLILKISDYKDNDQMLQTLTEDYGLLSFIAKGSKKPTSKHHFFESCIYEFIIDYKDGKTIYSIHGSKLLNSYYDLNDLKMMAFKNIIFEATIKSKELFDQNTYSNISSLLKNINDNNKFLYGSLYFSYLCRIHGIMPNVDECVVCGNKKVVAISNSYGGFVCSNHSNGEEILDVDTLKRFRLIVKAQFKDLEVIKDNVYSLKDFKLVIDFFIRNSGLDLKSYDFYKKIY